MLTVLFGILVGLALGLTGGGGSIFAIPLLVFGLGLPVQQAVPLSLAAVALASAVGAVAAWRERLVEWRAGTILVVGGMLAAPAGLALGRRLPETWILTGFAVLMILVALAMWRRASRHPGDAAVVRAGLMPAAASGAVCRFSPERTLVLSAPCSAALAVAGVVTGVLSGLFGVGGGFLIVPALVTITQLTIHQAVATSLLVIACIGASGAVAGMAGSHGIPLGMATLFAGGGIAGMLAGRVLASRLAGALMQKVFAVMMLVVAGVTLASRI